MSARNTGPEARSLRSHPCYRYGGSDSLLMPAWSDATQFSLLGPWRFPTERCGPSRSRKDHCIYGRPHPGPLAQDRDRPRRQGAPRRDRPLRHWHAVPRPLHRPRRYREVQELPRQAETPRREVALQHRVRHVTGPVTSTLARAGSRSGSTARGGSPPRPRIPRHARLWACTFGFTLSRISGLGRSTRSAPNTSASGSRSWRTRCPCRPIGGSSSPASRPFSPRLWMTTCSLSHAEQRRARTAGRGRALRRHRSDA